MVVAVAVRGVGWGVVWVKKWDLQKSSARSDGSGGSEKQGQRGCTGEKTVYCVSLPGSKNQKRHRQRTKHERRLVNAEEGASKETICVGRPV